MDIFNHPIVHLTENSAMKFWFCIENNLFIMISHNFKPTYLELYNFMYNIKYEKIDSSKKCYFLTSHFENIVRYPHYEYQNVMLLHFSMLGVFVPMFLDYL
jgi:hypothetical protein